MEVWTHEVNGYPVTSYKDPTAEVLTELRKNTTNRTYINHFTGGVLDIPKRVITPGSGNPMTGGYVAPVLETITRTEWLTIESDAAAARKAADKAKRIADRKAARQAAATALKAAKDANKIGLDPKTDQIIIVETAVTTVAQMAAGGITSEGEPA